MTAMRSILWVGRGEQFAAEWVQNAATLDVVWTADPDGDGARVGTAFDAIVLDVEGAVRVDGGVRSRRCKSSLTAGVGADFNATSR